MWQCAIGSRGRETNCETKNYPAKWNGQAHLRIYSPGGWDLNRIILTTLLLLGAAANASAQSIPKWELYGGYSEDLAGGGIAGERQLPSNGAQVELARVVTSYFRV